MGREWHARQHDQAMTAYIEAGKRQDKKTQAAALREMDRTARAMGARGPTGPRVEDAGGDRLIRPTR